MSEESAERVNKLLDTIARNSRAASAPRPALPAAAASNGLSVVINGAEHCTFILSSAAMPKAPANAPARKTPRKA